MFKIMVKLTFLSIFLLAGTFSSAGLAQEQIGVASAVNKNTTDLTLEQVAEDRWRQSYQEAACFNSN